MQSQPGLVTCLSGFQTSHQVVMSGSQGGPNGGLVQLWALHQPQNAVKGFALPPSAGFPTCLEQATGDTVILAGTSQKMIVQWDIK